MKHIKHINESVDFSDVNRKPYESYLKFLNDLIYYLEDNNLQKDAQKFFDKNKDKRIGYKFKLASSSIEQLLKEFESLKKD